MTYEYKYTDDPIINVVHFIDDYRTLCRKAQAKHKPKPQVRVAFKNYSEYNLHDMSELLRDMILIGGHCDLTLTIYTDIKLKDNQ